jgi:predicted transposase/invertase (TIGR01784 family)
MRRDSIFYKLFQQSPTLLFELLPDPPANAQSYRFDSVAVKEPRFEIDGVFLPPEADESGIVYFCEVQFQKDQLLYERVFAESALYFYRNRDRFRDWQAVIIYPFRSIEQDDIYPHRGLLNSNQVHRVYLEELGEIRQLPLWVAIMVLTTVEENRVLEEARYLLSRTQLEAHPLRGRAIIETITTILAYRFEQLSRLEIETMLDITLKDTRLYRDIREEGERSLVLRQLARQVGELPLQVRSHIEALPLERLEELGEVLLDFSSLDDLQAWLAKQDY